jgi:hypothetical protein
VSKTYVIETAVADLHRKVCVCTTPTLIQPAKSKTTTKKT